MPENQEAQTPTPMPPSVDNGEVDSRRAMRQMMKQPFDGMHPSPPQAFRATEIAVKVFCQLAGETIQSHEAEKTEDQLRELLREDARLAVMAADEAGSVFAEWATAKLVPTSPRDRNA